MARPMPREAPVTRATRPAGAGASASDVRAGLMVVSYRATMFLTPYATPAAAVNR